MINGIIIKAIAGFYYVETGDRIYECKARGIFRKNHESPLVGDKVKITIDENDKGIIESIEPRINSLVRPPVANIDRLFVVISIVEPAPNTLIIDKVIVNAENQNIEPVIIINKSDIASTKEIFDIYSLAGFKTFSVSAANNDGIDALALLIKGKTCAFTGNSGVGKSSILNSINSDFNIQTGDISKKLGRGRHTTRQIELYKTCGGYIADTPGFSSFDMERCDVIKKENLQFCFREFKLYLATCKYTSCSHTKEKGCSIIEAVKTGKISSSRHNNYIKLYEEASKIADWEFKK